MAFQFALNLLILKFHRIADFSRILSEMDRQPFGIIIEEGKNVIQWTQP